MIGLKKNFYPYFKVFDKYPNLVIGFSEKKHGPMKFSLKNRERFFNKLGIDKNSVIRADLVHKNKVALVSEKEAGCLIEKTDGLITKQKNIFLTITTADCLPIFIFNPKEEIIALVHAGWKSLASGILKNTIEKTGKHVVAGIGPGISQCHFKVGQDVLNFFKPYLKHALKGSFLDLKKIAKLQLMELGVKNIDLSFSLIQPWDQHSLGRLKGEMAKLRKLLVSHYRKSREIPVINFREDNSGGFFYCAGGQDRLAITSEEHIWGCDLFADYFRGKENSSEYHDYFFGNLDIFTKNYEKIFVGFFVHALRFFRFRHSPADLFSRDTSG